MPVPENLIASIDELEPLPVTVQKLISTVQEENVEFSTLAAIVEQDEALISNVLRSANSSSTAGRNQVTDARTAVVRLGTNRLLELALGGYMRNQKLPPQVYDLNEAELWRHSQATRIAVTKITKLRPDAGIDPLAPTAAIVHDIGKLIMVRYMEAEISDLLKLCEDKQITYVEAEREFFGCDHAEVGAEIGRAWSFPQPLIDVIAHHHDDPVEQPTPILDVVMVGNYISKTIGVGLGAQGMNVHLDEASMERLGLTYEEFCGITAETAIELREAE